MTLDYSHTLDALVGWIGRVVRTTAFDSEANRILVLNGKLGRAPDSAEPPNGEARFFCVGHDDPRDGADGFFLPSETFRHGMYVDPPLGNEPESILFIAFEGGAALLVERDPRGRIVAM
jgi:hypothetical protein